MLGESIVDMRFLDIRQKQVVGEELNPIKGWKSALLMQFQPQFQATILAGILFGFIVSMMNFIYAISNDRMIENDLRYYRKISTRLYSKNILQAQNFYYYFVYLQIDQIFIIKFCYSIERVIHLRRILFYRITTDDII